MASKQRYPPGPPMTLGKMRELGVHHLIGCCHNDACRHMALIDVPGQQLSTVHTTLGTSAVGSVLATIVSAPVASTIRGMFAGITPALKVR
jgi:hypothetical protein